MLIAIARNRKTFLQKKTPECFAVSENGFIFALVYKTEKENFIINLNVSIMKKFTMLVAAMAAGVASAFAASAPCTEAKKIVGTFSSDNLTFGQAWNNKGTHRWGDFIFEGYTSSYNWLEVVLSGNGESLRIDDSGVSGFWNASDGMGGKSILSDFSDEYAIGKDNGDVTLWYDINAIGLASAFYDGAVTIAMGDWGDENTSVTVKSFTVYDKAPNCSAEIGDVKPRWESQDGTVKVYGLEVEGNIDVDAFDHPNQVYAYNTMSKEWLSDYPRWNQNFTFAFEVVNDEGKGAKGFCDYTNAENADLTPTFGIHIWDDQNNPDQQKDCGDFRMERVEAGKYIYAVDMNASALRGAKEAVTPTNQGPFDPEKKTDPDLWEIWCEVRLAFLGGSEVDLGEASAWDAGVLVACLNLDFLQESGAADVIPAIDMTEEGWGTYVGATLTAGIAQFGTSNNPTGISDVYADEMGAEVVGIYNILGQELKAEPEAGAFIVKYSNGVSKKLVK